MVARCTRTSTRRTCRWFFVVFFFFSVFFDIVYCCLLLRPRAIHKSTQQSRNTSCRRFGGSGASAIFVHMDRRRCRRRPGRAIDKTSPAWEGSARVHRRRSRGHRAGRQMNFSNSPVAFARVTPPTGPDVLADPVETNLPLPVHIIIRGLLSVYTILCTYLILTST